jgi:hypothetical protein
MYLLQSKHQEKFIKPVKPPTRKNKLTIKRTIKELSPATNYTLCVTVIHDGWKNTCGEKDLVHFRTLCPGESIQFLRTQSSHFPLGKCYFISHTYLWSIFASNPNLGFRKRILLNTSSMPLDGASTTPTWPRDLIPRPPSKFHILIFREVGQKSTKTLFNKYVIYFCYKVVKVSKSRRG